MEKQVQVHTIKLKKIKSKLYVPSLIFHASIKLFAGGEKSKLLISVSLQLLTV